MAGPSLRPHVHWAQRHRELYLRVELSDVQNPDVAITDNVLHFRAQGHGAKGDNIYEFQIEFLEPVEPKPVCRVTQRQLNITVQKKESNWWERLTKQEKRPLFLAPDFDRWLDESDAEMELREKEEEKINKMKIESRIPKDPFKHLKKGYLIMYNLVQFLGFSWIFVNMTVRLFILGKDSFYDTFHTIGDMMYFCQTLALMETMNSLIGLVKSPLIPAVTQIFGRNFILFVVIGSLEEMQSKPVVFFIFYFWSIIELFRFVGFVFWQVCTEQCGGSQELLKEDFDLCAFWKIGTSALTPESKISFRHDCHSLPRLLHLPKAGARLESENNTALNLGKPVAFFLEGCSFEISLLHEPHYALFLIQKKYFERFIRQARWLHSSMWSE